MQATIRILCMFIRLYVVPNMRYSLIIQKFTINSFK